MRIVLFTAAAAAILLCSGGCATKTVMKNCEQVNQTEYWFCEHQYKVWR